VSDRWFPVLAAALGLLGGVLGAAVGGYIANQGQEQQFRQERAERIRELRIDTYTKFLRAAENEKVNGPRVADSIVATDELEVELLARNDSLREAAASLARLAMNWEGGDDSEYRNARTAFIELAHAEVETGE
jgi:hypothetical protein